MSWLHRTLVPTTLLAIFTASCGAGGSSENLGDFDLLGTNIATPGQIFPINQPLEFRFSKDVDPTSLHFGSISIQGLPPVTSGAPSPGPVAGSFFTKDGSKQTVVFQPACPTDAENSNGGLLPGNIFGPAFYQVTVGGVSGPTNAIVKALDGSRLARSHSFVFQTPTPPNSPLFDPQPTSAPNVIEKEKLPKILGLNLWSHPISPIPVEIDQPVIASSVDNHSIRLEFDHPHSGELANVPVTVTLVENCNPSGHALLWVVPNGVLPPGVSLRFLLSKTLRGFGLGDTQATDIHFHTALVENRAGTLQRDAIVETFSTNALQDPDPPSLEIPAQWANGQLMPGPLFPGANNDIDIEIGPNSTNGFTVVFSTDSGTLRDIQGVSHSFDNGVIEVRNFRIKAPLPGGKSQFFALGSHPLVIRASQTLSVEAGTFLVVDGQDALDATSVGLPNVPQPGGAGVCGGGDGGAGSPNTTGSDSQGGNGEGAFRLAGGGGKGGESGYGNVGISNNVGGGGGGGNFGVLEQDAQGNYVAFCYSTTPCSPLGCPMPLPSAASCTNPGCNGVFQNPASQGEPGASGPQCINQSTTAFQCDLGGTGGKICQRGAITGSCLARGGAAGPAVFTDTDFTNNFLGRKPSVQNGRVQILRGELPILLPGQGGGGGGDTVVNPSFPSSNFLTTDMKAGAGGGGAGALVLQALRSLEIRGTIRANGGNGSSGEQISGGGCGTAAGGGGSGGSIVLECVGQTIFGNAARVTSLGGNRGYACLTIPGQPQGNLGANYCRTNVSAGRGGAGGKGPIMLAIPWGSATNASSCGGLLRPPLQAGSLFVEDSSGSPQPVNCERDPLLASIADPDFHLVIPSFGPRSSASSRWLYLGWSDIGSTPQFEFRGSDPQGILDSQYLEVLASGSAANATILSSHRIALDSQTLVDLIAWQASILREDAFQADPSLPAAAIVAASVQGSRVLLDLSPQASPLSSVGSWKLLRRFFVPLIEGNPAPFPPGTQASILFEGAAEIGVGTGMPDLASVVGPVANPASLAGKKFLRFHIKLDRNVLGSPLSNALPSIGLDSLKIPYSF